MATAPDAELRVYREYMVKDLKTTLAPFQLTPGLLIDHTKTLLPMDDTDCVIGDRRRE